MADKKSSPQQIAQSVYETESNSISVRDTTNMVPSSYNEIQMTYDVNNPEPSTVTYLTDGVIVTVINFEYDLQGRVIRVFRSA
jgi:hypothetical protein